MNKLSLKVLMTAASLVAALSANLGTLPHVASAEMSDCWFTHNCGQCPAEEPDCGQTEGTNPLGPKPHRVVAYLGTAPRAKAVMPLAACQAVYGTETNSASWASYKLAKCYDVEIVWF